MIVIMSVIMLEIIMDCNVMFSVFHKYDKTVY